MVPPGVGHLPHRKVGASDLIADRMPGQFSEVV
jgi:hypothetical protein